MAEYVVVYDTVTGRLLGQLAQTAHIADGAVTSGKIGSGQVGPHIAADAVLSAHVGALVIGDPHIRSGVVDAARLTGTLQDARLPTVQAGKTFSGNIDILGTDRYIRNPTQSGNLIITAGIYTHGAALSLYEEDYVVGQHT